MSTDPTTTGAPTSGAHAAASVSEGPPLGLAANGSPAVAMARTPAISAESGEIVFEILVAVMWSDGELVSGEVERGRAAVDLMRIRPKRGGALGAIADGPLPFPSIAFDRLDRQARRLAYAAACWLDGANRAPSARRRSFIGAVRIKLDVGPAAAELAAIARQVEVAFDDPRDAFAALMRRI